MSSARNRPRPRNLLRIEAVSVIPSISAQPAHKADMSSARRGWRTSCARRTFRCRCCHVCHPVSWKNKQEPNRRRSCFTSLRRSAPRTMNNDHAAVQNRPFGTARFTLAAPRRQSQVWCHVEAISAWQQHGGLPVNLVVMIEGEEEVGSVHLEDFIKQHGDRLRADIMLISDTRSSPRLARNHLRLRGLSYAEIFLTGPGHIAQRQFGGRCRIRRMCCVNGGITARRRRLREPAGFYDDVVPLSRPNARCGTSCVLRKGILRGLRIRTAMAKKGYTSIERNGPGPRAMSTYHHRLPGPAQKL